MGLSHPPPAKSKAAAGGGSAGGSAPCKVHSSPPASTERREESFSRSRACCRRWKGQPLQGEEQSTCSVSRGLGVSKAVGNFPHRLLRETGYCATRRLRLGRGRAASPAWKGEPKHFKRNDGIGSASVGFFYSLVHFIQLGGRRCVVGTERAIC